MTEHVRYFCQGSRCTHSFPYKPGKYERTCPICGSPVVPRYVRALPTLVEPIKVRSLVSVFEQIDQAKDALRKKFG